MKSSLAASELRYEIISALGTAYKEICIVDLKAKRYTVISGTQEGRSGSLDNLSHNFIDINIMPNFREEAEVFLDFGTCAERLENKSVVSHDFQAKSGMWYQVSFIAKKRDENGKVTHILVTARDITEQKLRELAYQKKLEDIAAEARRANKAKTNFLRRMSHDIRTPLNGIIGLLDIDMSHFDDRELVLENHTKMKTSANHLLSLINDVLQMSKLEDGKANLKGMHFLLAEDNELNSEIVTELLKAEGATCDVAVNGQLAAERFISSPAKTYTAVLMDFMMTVMNGYEATKAIRASKHPEALTIPIVAMTANAFVKDVQDALDAGMNAHIAKPINMDTLKNTLGSCIKP